MILQNLSSRTLKLKKGTRVAHVEASQMVPPVEKLQMKENLLRNVVTKSPGSDRVQEEDDRFFQILEKLDLEGIKSWTEQQQQSVRRLLREYQHLFALNLKELGKTSMVQHEIRLSDKTPFKE